MNCLKCICKIPFMKTLLATVFRVKKPVNFVELNFYNAVGVAAGFDKNAKYLAELACLGFGFVEIGTVTPLPQNGNEKPRLFRLKKDEALINRMGFNNDGMLAIAERLKNRPKNLIVGGNIGKNKTTPNENAVEDYEKCFKTLYPVVDYFVVNISSPNTPNLRDLHDKKPLAEILNRLLELRKNFEKSKPIFLKISPDLSYNQIDDVVEIVIETNIDGIVATNTTITRDGLDVSNNQLKEIGAGGLSGKILSKRSNEIIAYIHQKTNGKLPIIGVGGIHSLETAQEKINAGAGLIQIYTSFIYKGPSLIKNIAKKLQIKFS